MILCAIKLERMYIMSTVSNKDLFETMPIPKAIAALAVPTVVSQLIALVYNTVDAFFIGRTGNSYMIAGSALAYTIFMMTVAFSNMFGLGGGSLIARLSGIYEYDEARNEQGKLYSNIAEIKDLIENAEIVDNTDADLPKDSVTLGSIVQVVENVYHNGL